MTPASERIPAVHHGANAGLIATVFRLPMLALAESDLVLDATYGRGRFWTEYRPPHLIPHDLKLDGVDFRHLPEADHAITIEILDPPYVSPGGRKTSTIKKFHAGYGTDDVPRTVAETRDMIQGGIKEASRVLRPGGFLLLKSMDYVSGGKLRPERIGFVTFAQSLGFTLADTFLLIGSPRAQPPHQRQEHSAGKPSYLDILRAPR